MSLKFVDRVKEVASNKPNGATVFNLPDSGATGFRSFDSVLATNDVVGYTATNGTDWEIGFGTFTAGTPDTLARTSVLASSNSGNAVDFSGGGDVTVWIDFPAAIAQSSLFAQQSVIPGGRLTLTSGTPVTTSDVTGATTVYYTPYLHNIINLWDGYRWVPTEFSETSLALGTVTSGANYDVFAYLNAGALALEKLAWTDDTTRATSITIQDGRLCKSGDKTRLYLGTFRSTSTTETADAAACRYLWNMYNRVFRSAYKQGTTQHTYTSSAERPWNNSQADTEIKWITGLTSIVDLYLFSRQGREAAAPNAVTKIALDGSAVGSIFQFYGSSAGASAGGVSHEAALIGAHSAYVIEQSHSGGDQFYEASMRATLES